MNKLFALCLFVSILAGVYATDLLQGSRLDFIDICIHDVKGTFSYLEQTIEEFKQDLGVLLKILDQAIEKCADASCWMNGQKRCENDTSKQCEKWGLIWYPKCDPGYHNFGCCMCAQDCPSGFRNDGLFCRKPSAYGRGVGYPWKFGDGFNLEGARTRCQHDNTDLGCEQWGLIIYPKCREHFHHFGCCVCSPDCPSEMTDIGISCKKKFYGRGIGYISGKCIQENWNDYTPIDKIGKCIDQAKQIGKDIEDVIKSIEPSSDDQKWNSIKLVYTLLQHANPFLVHCIDPLVNKVSES